MRRWKDDIQTINRDPQQQSIYPYIIMSSIIYPYKPKDDKLMDECVYEYQIKTYLQNNNAIVRFINDIETSISHIIELIPNFNIRTDQDEEQKLHGNNDDEHKGDQAIHEQTKSIRVHDRFCNDNPFRDLHSKFKQMEKPP